MKKFRACVIGVGFIGAAHIEALRRLGNVEVVAVSGTSNTQAKANAHFVPKGYDDYKAMLDTEKPDVVHICTPNASHFDMAMYAMERGISVVCEKPLTKTLDEAKKLAAYAKKHNIVTGVNFNCRWYPQIMQVKAMIQSGEVGAIHTIHGGYLQDWLFFDTDYSWRLEPELSGNSRAFADIGSHWIDMVESATGLRVVELLADFETFHKIRRKPLKPIETFSGMALRPEDYEEKPIHTEDYCTVVFRFNNGAHGTCTISQVFAGRKNQILLSISGSKCSLHWDSEDSNELWIGRRETYNQKIAKDPSILSPLARASTSYPGGHVEGFPDTFKQNFKAIYAAIEAGDTSRRDFANFEDGLREMELCEAVVRSAKKDRWVKVGE
ncbi:MAG: Gfo/Idh/MocA family oxidoreductase [Eubacteriales bacterium]|nr:Gfo/Idh/MocA family oxidoreductase [Eubacteriales bacterium]